ncbi:MAG: proline--tRNA ligase [Peptococcaceae bacterium]|nr:proline--tRNA ligase [Peptococcaceae bacterium]
MKIEKLIGERFKERPADCPIDSHALMIRGGYMKYVANGIFSSYTVLRRITRKIEQIIREEMDAIDGQEVLFPVVLPASLWQESGRYENVGHELLRFRDRNEIPMLLGMTHEEAAVHLVREHGRTYTKYPFMVYQIQTKFRDELRPRGGLIRVREFTMKDAYSFHTSQKDLDAYFKRCYHAYERIFSRVGIPQAIAVSSDSGMMGGSVSYEFMLLTPVGEDSIVTCSCCDYRANMEAAESIVFNENSDEEKPLEKVHTPDKKTIEDVCHYLNLPVENSCKAVVYQKNATDEYVIVFIRGDLDVNETKLGSFLQEEIHAAVITESNEITAGFIGPDKTSKVSRLFDRSLKGIASLCCGANEIDYHYTGFNIERDFGPVDYHDLAKATEGGICPRCGEPSLAISRGIEIGHIFQLGTKYTAPMDMSYMDDSGDLHHPFMGCYGIGIGRLAASICEARHDEFGPVWPLSVAPWQVHLCCVRADDEQIRAFADSLYSQLQSENIEVIYDDRLVSAGVMFSDADLLGVPVRIIVSPRNMMENCCEIVTRDKSVNRKIKADEIIASLQELLRELLPFPFHI